MIVDEIEKYVREINRTDDVHLLKISHIGKLMSLHGFYFSNSSLGGHKFAGNVIVYPSGTWYGRVLTCHIPLLIDAYTSSSEDLKEKLKPLYRGHLDTAW
jgi:(2Fe-2S) ferredoxin